MAGPFRVSMGDGRRCLEALREADRLLDSAPRTAAAEQAAAASDQVTGAGLVGGVLGAALAATNSRAATPGAARELAEAIELLREVGDELGDHPAAAEVEAALSRWRRAPLKPAAKHLGALVRELHPRLRSELGLMDTPALTNWAVDDADDIAALNAAGLGARARAIKIGIAALVVALVYLVLGTR